MAFLVPANQTGAFEDNSAGAQDTTSVADKLAYSVIAGPGSGTGSATFVMDWIGAHYFASNPAGCMIGGTPLPNFSGISSGNTYYSSLFGGGNIFTDLTRATGKFPYASAVSNFVNHLTSVGIDDAATFTVLINGLPSVLSLSSPAHTKGFFIDSSHTVTVAAGDTCANQVVVSSGSAVTWDGAGLLLTSL